MSYQDLQALLINSFSNLDSEKQTNENAYTLNEVKDMLQDAMDRRLKNILRKYNRREHEISGSPDYCKNLTEFEISLLNPDIYPCRDR